MTAYLPRRAVIVLAVILALIAVGGTRCGDAYRSDRTTTVVTR